MVVNSLFMAPPGCDLKRARAGAAARGFGGYDFPAVLAGPGRRLRRWLEKLPDDQEHHERHDHEVDHRPQERAVVDGVDDRLAVWTDGLGEDDLGRAPVARGQAEADNWHEKV